MPRLDAAAGGTGGSATRTAIPTAAVATAMSRKARRQSSASLSATPIGTPATVASESPAEPNIIARPMRSGLDRRAATVIDMDQNALIAAPSRKRATRIAGRLGAMATTRLETVADAAAPISSVRRSRRGSSSPTVGAKRSPRAR